MVVGGRFGTVGLGLALGAGFSYLTNDRGLAVDNIVAHRVVLADGSVVEARADGEYADLHWALRGGNSNFGVVTHFVFETVPTDGMFGGRVTYAPGTLGQLQDVTYDYQVSTAVEGRDVHVLPTYIYDGASNSTFGFSPVVYNRNATELPDSLKPWLEIEHTNSTVRSRTFGDLADELVAGFPDGLV